MGALQNLVQDGDICSYVKQFAAFMLDISDMSENDKLFMFLEGLRPEAQA